MAEAEIDSIDSIDSIVSIVGWWDEEPFRIWKRKGEDLLYGNIDDWILYPA